MNEKDDMMNKAREEYPNLTDLKRTNFTKENLIKVAREYGKKSAAQLAQEMGIMPSQVNSIVSSLKKMGVKVAPRPKRNETMIDALEELKDMM